MRGWVRSAIIVVLCASMASAAPLSLNLTSAFADTKSKLQQGQTADVLMLGDSLSFREGSYLPYFRQRLQQKYGNAGFGYQGLSLWSGGGLNQGWLRTGVNTDMVPHRSLDGLWNQYDGVAAWPNAAEVYPYDRNLQIQYLTGPGRGSFEIWDQNYNPVATIHTNTATTNFATYNHTLPPTHSALFYVPLRNGPLTVLGHINTSGQNGIRIHRAANGGWGVNNFLQRDETFDQQLATVDPELVMIWLGQNDQGESRASYAAKMGQLVDRIHHTAPDAEVVFIGTYNQGSPLLSGLVEGMYDAAQARGLGFINMYHVAGGPQFFQLNGFLADGVHFTEAGGNYLGNLLADAFFSDGRSLSRYAKEGLIHQLPVTVPMPGTINSARGIPEPLSGIFIAATLLLVRRR